MLTILYFLMSYGQSTRTTGNNISKPVETGKEYTVDITDNGSARIEAQETVSQE